MQDQVLGGPMDSIHSSDEEVAVCGPVGSSLGSRGGITRAVLIRGGQWARAVDMAAKKKNDGSAFNKQLV